MNLNDIVTSPKMISGDHRAWEGTLQELIDWEVDRWEGTAQGMIQAGRLTEAEWEADDFDLADYVGRMTLEDVQHLADDPNAKVAASDAVQSVTPDELQARREALGLSQQALGEALGVKQATISYWEGGKRPIPEGVAGEVADLEDLQEDVTDQVVDFAVGRSAKLGTPTVRWDQPPPEGAPQGLADRAVTMAARRLRQEHEITLRF